MVVKEKGQFSNGEAVTHWNRIHPNERAVFGFQAISFYEDSAKGVWTVQHYDLLAMRTSRLQAQGHGIDEGIDPGPNVLKINNERVYVFHHGLSGHSGFAIEAEDRYIENRVEQIIGRDHVVLLFSKKSVLRAEKSLKLAGETVFN